MTLNSAAESFARFPSPSTERMARPWPIVWTTSPGRPRLHDDVVGTKGERARVFAIVYPSEGEAYYEVASHDDPDLAFPVAFTEFDEGWQVVT